MKVRQYAALERSITAADQGGIRERWLYGLRLLADPEAIAPAGGLRHGVAERLNQAAGGKLSAREIQRRMQCARTYPTEGQIRHAVAGFATWRDLSDARFPAYPADPNEPPADWRTVAEKRADMRRDLAAIGIEQEGLWPVDRFDPRSTTLKDFSDFMDRQDRITEGFVAVGKRRRAEFEVLSEAVGHDWSVSWRDAHLAAFGEDLDPDDEPESS